MLSEFYKKIGGNANDVIHRFGSENFIIRFVKKFKNDESFGMLEKELAAGNTDKAFLAAHTLKGICVNLGFSNLGKISSEITEALREDDLGKARSMFPSCKSYYSELIKEIDSLK